MAKRRWQDIDPGKEPHPLPHDGIHGPKNEIGQECPWPWQPQYASTDMPIASFYCHDCGAEVVAGFYHPDYSEEGAKELVEKQKRYRQYVLENQSAEYRTTSNPKLAPDLMSFEDWLKSNE